MKGFVKFILILALAAGLVFEIGSPVWAHTDASGAAQDAANAAARDYFDNNNLDSAKTAAVNAAAVRGAKVTKITMLSDGTMQVTVTRPAKSYVLHRISTLKNWYNVTETATAAPIRA
jgi:Flp pilus assembly protein TadG